MSAMLSAGAAAGDTHANAQCLSRQTADLVEVDLPEVNPVQEPRNRVS